LVAAFEREDLCSRLRAEIRSLPIHQRTVIRRYYEGDCPVAQIARELNVPLTTVKKRLHDARRRLRKRLKAEHLTHSI